MQWDEILNPAILVLMIPIAGIFVGGAIEVSRMWIRHRERMAMIEQGLNPDPPAKSRSTR